MKLILFTLLAVWLWAMSFRSVAWHEDPDKDLYKDLVK